MKTAAAQHHNHLVKTVRKMAVGCIQVSIQETGEEPGGEYEQELNEETRQGGEEQPDPTHKLVTSHTREAQLDDHPSSKILRRVTGSLQQIYLIGYTILQLLYKYFLEDPDVVELLLLLLLIQVWRFFKWSFILIRDILECVLLYHVNHIRLSPSLSRFAKKIFCQQKSFGNIRLSVEETKSIDISGGQTEKGKNDKRSEGGEELSGRTHKWVSNQTKSLDQTLSEIWGKIIENFQQMFLIVWEILHPICKHFRQEQDMVELLLMLMFYFWRCVKWPVILFVLTIVYIIFCCVDKVRSACSSLSCLREKFFPPKNKPFQETAGDTLEDLQSIVIDV